MMKEARVDNRERTVFLINGFGKAGEPEARKTKLDYCLMAYKMDQILGQNIGGKH